MDTLLKAFVSILSSRVRGVQGHLQCFLQVCETELLGGSSDFVDEGVGELDVVITLKLALPILAIQSTFILVGVIEETGEGCK